jgi:hypothetical protein
LTKLLKLKEWLTVPDAARHLSILFGEEVSEADVLRLALDGHLTLSVDFVNPTSARCGPVVPFEATKVSPLRTLKGKIIQSPDGINLGDGRVIELGEAIEFVGGVWDLMMVGAERLDVERRYQMLTDGPAVSLTILEGPVVRREEGVACRLEAYFGDNEFFDKKNLQKPFRDPENYHPAGGLPDDSVFVVRTAALKELEARILETDKPTEKPIQRRERTTLLVMVAALAKLAKIDVTKPSSAATAVESQTTLMGVRVAARTVENHLKRIPEALDSRAED